MLRFNEMQNNKFFGKVLFLLLKENLHDALILFIETGIVNPVVVA